MSDQSSKKKKYVVLRPCLLHRKARHPGDEVEVNEDDAASLHAAGKINRHGDQAKLAKAIELAEPADRGRKQPAVLTDINGLGKKTAEAFEGAGVETVAQLAAADDELVAKLVEASTASAEEIAGFVEQAKELR